MTLLRVGGAPTPCGTATMSRRPPGPGAAVNRSTPWPPFNVPSACWAPRPRSNTSTATLGPAPATLYFRENRRAPAERTEPLGLGITTPTAVRISSTGSSPCGGTGHLAAGRVGATVDAPLLASTGHPFPGPALVRCR